MNTTPSLPFVTVSAWFEHQARATPDAVALTFDETSITYAELNRRSNKLARVLQALGIGPDRVVAFCLARTPELIVALLAVMKSGGAYLPVDRDLPPERQAHMLRDAQPALLLTERAFRDALPAADLPVFVLDAETARIAAESDADLPSTVTGENLVYILYTSGSTGLPKGVEISHRALVNLLDSVRDWPGLNASDVFLALTTVSFDIAGVEIFLPLVTGARMVLLNRDDAGDGFRIIHHLEKQKATVLQATPSTWRMLLEAKWAGRPGLKMICTGEALPRDLGDALIPLGGELWNMYGPTETTIWSSGCKVAPSPARITIGQPVANTQLHILDPKLRPVPPGVAGELYIGGLGLARAYRNRPELTAERFIPDLFSSEPGARLYKTGDVARTRGSEIEVLGRMDHQVKIRGFRIELGEIEARLNEFPGVKESVVVAHEIVPGRKQLAAYLVLREPSAHAPEVFAASLRDFLKRTLPEYMVPSFFQPMPAFPITPNGKIDRKALPAPRIEQAKASRPYVAPTGPVETKLAGIWREILGRDQVGVEDDIFEIGGDSLLIFRIVARANEAGLPLAVRQFFQHRTIAALAAQVGDAGTAVAPVRPSLVAVSRHAYRRPAPAAHAP
jgi:amino acid adenylation domain-containing protein